MPQEVKLAKHQANATRLFALAVANQLPIIVVECENKIAPDEKVRVLAVAFTNTLAQTTLLVPVARLFDDEPMACCYQPKLVGVNVEPANVISPFDEEMAGWKLQLMNW